MNSVDELRRERVTEPAVGAAIQGGTYLLELSLDWIVCRASENIHHLLGQSHVALIDEPLGDFVHAQPLHDLRNLFSRLSGTTGIARAYRVRLTDEPQFFDVAFQQLDERVIVEAVPTLKGRWGETLSAVGGLASGLSRDSGQALFNSAARRMRALTAFDRVTLIVGGDKATSSRTGVPFRAGANASLSDNQPVLIPDTRAEPVSLFPRRDDDSAASHALLRALTDDQKSELVDRGFQATMRIPVVLDGEAIAEFRLAHTKPRAPNLELHAAAELFAQLFAMQLEIDRLKSR